MHIRRLALVLLCAFLLSMMLVPMVTSEAAAQGMTTLPTGTLVEDAFTNDGDSHYYQVSVGAGEHLVLMLDSTSGDDYNELYIKEDIPVPPELVERASIVVHQAKMGR